MPDSKFPAFLDACVKTFAPGGGGVPLMSFIETHRGLADSPEEQLREDRLRALMKFIHASAMECAEKVVDFEMAPVDGTRVEPRFQLRENSLYYAYNLARKNAYEGFTEDQRQVLRGLILRTAYETMFEIVIRLESISEHTVNIRLQPKDAPDLQHDLHEPDIDGHHYWDDSLPASLSKYEY